MNIYIGVIFVTLVSVAAGIYFGLLIAQYQQEKSKEYKRANHGRVAPIPKYKIPVPPIGAKRK